MDLSDNYYLRECYKEREQVPTQSVMINKMGPPLAKVYFKSMDRKLKVLAGLEPPMKGGGNDWYITPKEVLAGRLAMQPVKHDHLTKLGFNGIAFFGELLVADHHKKMEEEKKRMLLESDINWKKRVEKGCRKQWDELSKAAAQANTLAIQQAFEEFTTMYATSITKIESLLFDAAVAEIKEMRQSAFEKMKANYEQLLKNQAMMLSDRYMKKLNKENAKLKENFIKKIEETYTNLGENLHDINLDKHVTIEKLRKLLECLNLACQVYVALKEREECAKEMNISQQDQKKTVTALKETIAMKDLEIRLALEKEKKQQEFNTIWKKKICAVVKKFQMFTSYCLNELPQYAEFFNNMEKLMMMQLNEAVLDPETDSIFETDVDQSHTPAPIQPFYLFCDKGYKPQLNEDLCPKTRTSSASQLPVVVVNKRCIYAACDNFEKYTDKMMEFIQGHRGEDLDFDDDNTYENYVPVKVTSSEQILELKLQSSIMQVLQAGIPNIRELPLECGMCNIPHCFCSPIDISKIKLDPPETMLPSVVTLFSSDKKIATRSVELLHEREPKWESYMQYIMPTQCKCGKRAKKHLEEHLPVYMRNVSMYDVPCLPNYEISPLATLKRLVRKAQRRPPSPTSPIREEPKTCDAGVQYSDPDYDFLCTCFSDDEVKKLFKEILKGADTDQPQQFKIVGDDVSASYLDRGSSSFASDCAYALRDLIQESPQLEQIFMKQDCKYD